MKTWSPAEIKTLKQMYAASDPLALVTALGRSWSAIRRKANDLGLKRAGFFDPAAGVMRKCRIVHD